MRSLAKSYGPWVPTILKRIWPKKTGPSMVSAQKLSDEAFLSLFEIKEVSAFLAQRDIPAAKEALLDHYGRRATPDWPDPPRTITDLRINTDQLSQEELIDRANSILKYHFSPDGMEPKITPEGNIDWHFNPILSPEWIWRLNRHQWWPILGLAYKQTNNERYTAAFVNQMSDWISKNPPPIRKNEKSPSWRLMEAGMRMRVSWIPAFALFYESPVFTDEAKLIMLRSIYDHARFLFLFKTERNHLLRESNGLAYGSFCFPEFKEAKLWQQEALTRLDQELTNQINQDGTHIEVSTGYQWLVVDEFEKTYDLLRSHNISLANGNLTSKLGKMCQVLACLVRPDGSFPEVNDGFMRWKYTRLAQSGEIFGRDDFVYIGTAGKQGSPPEYTSVAFDNAGLYVMRSDWTREARYLLFDAGPYGGPHGHEDKLSIELFAFGQPFIVDSGTYTYAKKDPFRNYFVGSQGHNTILVDGRSQIRRWHKKNMNPKLSPGNFATWISQAGFDYVVATYNEGYSSFSLYKPEAPEIIEDVTHTRRILFVKPDYWVIVDELQASSHHSFQLLFHTPPGIKIRAGSNNRAILSSEHDAPTLYLIPAEAKKIKLSWLAGSEDPIQGWYSVDHHRKMPSTVVIYERENSMSTVLTTLLYPCPAGQKDTEANIEPIEVSEGDGLAYLIITHRGRDYLMFSQDDAVKKFGNHRSKGIVAGIRTNINGEIFTEFEVNGSQCSKG